jgi:hypothetical protein
MHESERNRLNKLKTVLLLAASDMVQAEAAARALESEHGNVALMRALETAIGVCYARAFTQSSLKTLPPEYIPTTPDDARLHPYLCELRDKVYAHTDKSSGRAASIKAEAAIDAEAAVLKMTEQWNAFPRELIESAVGLFHRQRGRFLDDAVAIQTRLDAAS